MTTAASSATSAAFSPGWQALVEELAGAESITAGTPAVLALTDVCERIDRWASLVGSHGKEALPVNSREVALLIARAIADPDFGRME